MRHYSEFGFADPDNARSYAASGPRPFVPGFDAMHAMSVQLLEETMSTNGHALVLGAGGGHELRAFYRARPEWRFTAVDPSPEMLASARDSLAQAPITWIEGYVEDAPDGPFDGATCLLTLHLIPDDGQKRSTLLEIGRRLKPGAAFILVDNCLDFGSPDADRGLARYLTYARSQGTPQEALSSLRSELPAKSESIDEVREVELLQQAGFRDIELFYAGLSWRGWVAFAAD